MIAKLVCGALSAIRAARSRATSQPGAVVDDVLRQADGGALLGVVPAAGEHQVGHPGDADQSGHAHRGAAADEDPAHALRQGVERGPLGHPEVRGRSQLETAADHRALERGDHRDRAELDLLEGSVPHARVAHSRQRVPLGHLGEVEAGAEVVTVGVDDHAGDVVGQPDEEPLDPEHRRVVERVALGRTGQGEDGDLADPRRTECGREVDVEDVRFERFGHGRLLLKNRFPDCLPPAPSWSSQGAAALSRFKERR